jgi:mRNA interferase MazF
MEYFKNHDAWSIFKKIIESREPIVSFHEGEIWWCNIGVNIGSELDGKGEQFTRLVVIMKKTSPTIFYALPLSSKKATLIYHIPIVHDGKTSYAVMSQIFACSSKRLERCVWIMSRDELRGLKERLTDILTDQNESPR